MKKLDHCKTKVFLVWFDLTALKKHLNWGLSLFLYLTLHSLLLHTNQVVMGWEVIQEFLQSVPRTPCAMFIRPVGHCETTHLHGDGCGGSAFWRRVRRPNDLVTLSRGYVPPLTFNMSRLRHVRRERGLFLSRPKESLRVRWLRSRTSGDCWRRPRFCRSRACRRDRCRGSSWSRRSRAVRFLRRSSAELRFAISKIKKQFIRSNLFTFDIPKFTIFFHWKRTKAAEILIKMTDWIIDWSIG